MKGYIVINPFLLPKESVHQAERLKEEFNKLAVTVDIISDGYLAVLLKDSKLSSMLVDADFIVYLDKDKYLSKVLDGCGLRLFNSHESVRVCDDKGETYIALADKGVKLPNTIFGALCYKNDCKIDESSAKIIADKLGYPVIVKESFGSQGKGVYLAKNQDELLTIMESVKLKPHLFQEYIDYKKGTDVRVIVIGGKAVAYMERSNENDFRSNVARGGSGKKVDIPDNFIKTAENVANILNLDYCGVDLLYGKAGEPIVCEVNSNAFIDGIEKVAGVNVAKKYAEYIIETVKK